VLYATWRATARPSPSGELLALISVVVAALCRTQLIALAPIIPLAVLWHEVQFGLRGMRAVPRLRALPQRLITRHPLITVVTTITVLAFILNQAHALPGNVVGELTRGYGVPQLGPLADEWARLTYYLARMTAGTGFIAGALGLAWGLREFVRARSSGSHTLAVVCALGIAGVLLGLVTGGPDERYVVYAAAPIGLAFAAALEDGLRVRRRGPAYVGSVIAGVLATILVVDGVGWPAPAGPYDYFTYPADSFYSRVLMGRLSDLHIPLVHPAPDHLLELGVVLVALAWLAIVVRFQRAVRPAAVALGIAVVAFCATEMLYAEQQFTTSAAAAAGGPTAAQRSWVDRHVPAGATVAAITVGLGETSDFADIWHTLEFWNSSIQTDAFFQALGPIPVPLGNVVAGLGVAPDTGLVSAASGPPFTTPYSLPRYVLMPRVNSLPVGFDALKVQVDPVMLVNLETLSLPVRLDWRLNGISAEGFIAPGQPAIATIYRSAFAGGRRCASFTLGTPPNFTGRWPYEVSSGGRVVARGRLAAQQARSLTVPLLPQQVSGNPQATVEVRVRGQVLYPTGSDVSAAIDNFAVEACPD
jgi:hypothetical protein